MDIATTGNRYGVDRILGAAVRTTGGTSRDWLIDPGPGALSVAPTKHHGITLDEARAKGMSASQALDELATVLASHLARTEPLVAWHAPFVLTTLETELLRHELTPLADRVPDGLEPICDPLVLDRQAAPFRFGGHSLEAVTEWYGVTHDRPGHPGHDAKASLIVAYIIGACYPAIGRLSRPTLHQKQAHWHERQMQEAEILHPSGSWGRQWPTADVHVQPWQDQPA
ncbi:3'-5' exonuclease [Streptomyces rectiviolaceus]|uniref:3'-5' exonuclease n=1 Tax=Streptomyces rectiviolaceus TaxID=332591 RepID=UPI0036318311